MGLARRVHWGEQQVQPFVDEQVGWLGMQGPPLHEAYIMALPDTQVLFAEQRLQQSRHSPLLHSDPALQAPQSTLRVTPQLSIKVCLPH
jgi:hypothetical protein